MRLNETQNVSGAQTCNKCVFFRSGLLEPVSEPVSSWWGLKLKQTIHAIIFSSFYWSSSSYSIRRSCSPDTALSGPHKPYFTLLPPFLLRPCTGLLSVWGISLVFLPLLGPETHTWGIKTSWEGQSPGHLDNLNQTNCLNASILCHYVRQGLGADGLKARHLRTPVCAHVWGWLLGPSADLADIVLFWESSQALSALGVCKQIF